MNFISTYTTKSQLIKYLMSIMLLLNTQIAMAGKIPSEIKSYLSSVKSIAVEFTQTDANGGVAKGMLIIDKPYKFRCNYYEPFPIVIIGNKNYVSVYDYEMEHLSRIKAAENIFNFLLVDKVSFDNQFEILSAKTQGNSYVMRLKNHDLNKISEISFDVKTKHIQKMKIFEENNSITLTFGKTQQIRSAKKSLFIIQSPEVFGAPKRLNKKDLQKSFKLAS